MTQTVWTGVQLLYLSRKKWGDIPRYAHILLYFWPETYTQKEEIRKHDLICHFVYLCFKIPFFVTRNFTSYTFFSHYLFFLLPLVLLLIDSPLHMILPFVFGLISGWKSRLEIRIIKTGRKESLLDTALWWLSRFFLYLISFVRNQVVGKKRSTTQIASAAMLEPVLKYLESICTTM